MAPLKTAQIIETPFWNIRKYQLNYLYLNWDHLTRRQKHNTHTHHNKRNEKIGYFNVLRISLAAICNSRGLITYTNRFSHTKLSMFTCFTSLVSPVFTRVSTTDWSLIHFGNCLSILSVCFTVFRHFRWKWTMSKNGGVRWRHLNDAARNCSIPTDRHWIVAKRRWNSPSISSLESIVAMIIVDSSAACLAASVQPARNSMNTNFRIFFVPWCSG